MENKDTPKISIREFLDENHFMIGNSASFVNKGRSIGFDPTVQKFTIQKTPHEPKKPKRLLTNNNSKHAVESWASR